MRILVTGANGFTGQEFVRSAAAAGHTTVALSADLSHAKAVAQEIAALEIDAVVHLAAISFVGHDDDRAFYNVNLFGTLNLLDALKSAGRPLQKVLLASSANVYGNCEQSPIDETQPPAPVNHYAMSKLAMECMSRGHSAHLPIVITRPFNYTGPGQAPKFVIPKLVDHFRRRAPSVALGNLHVHREYNDVRFVCAAYLGLLDSKSSSGGTYNICTGQTYSFHDVRQSLEDLTGHRLEVRIDPSLVRANEVHRLCGDPALLRSTVAALPQYSLRDTLSWMLSLS